MARSITLRGAQLVLPDRVVTGDLVAEDGIITEIAPRVAGTVGEEIDGRGLVALPGAVDTHVRLDALEDMARLGPALLAGGITSAVGVRQADNAARLAKELAALAELSPVNYGLYVRVEDAVDAALAAGPRAAGYWLASVRHPQVEALFERAVGPIVVDAHDPERLAERWALWPGAPAPADLPRIHDVDTCVQTTRRALDLAARYGSRTHLLQLSTAEELALLPGGRVTASVSLAHLFADDRMYEALGTRAVCAPPIRGPRHPVALWEGLHGGQLWIASAHFPVGLDRKEVPLPRTHPGWPTAEWLLPLLLDAASRGRCTWLDIARWTSRFPAEGLGLRRKGRLETGYDADIVLADPTLERTVAGPEAPIRTVAGWSPWAGRAIQGWPVHTVVGGTTAWVDGQGPVGVLGRELRR